MQRDMDLIRQILFKMEEHSEGSLLQCSEIQGDYAPEQIGYHIWLLVMPG